MLSLLRRTAELVLAKLPRLGRRRGPLAPAQAQQKRNTALMLMYSGTGYRGMQRQQLGQPTIEAALLDCLLAAGRITPAQHASPALQLGFGCASKTDSGVSALAQVVNLRLDLSNPEALVLDLNARLPERVRVLDAVRVTGGFSGRYRVSRRTYAYLCPSFAFSPSSPRHPQPLPSAFAYRLEPRQLDRLRRCLARFLGTSNYCNFTAGRLPDDPACLRHLFDCRVEGPFLYCGLEFVEIRLVGQSFMRHQIRKMVGLLIAVLRGHHPESALDAALSPCQHQAAAMMLHVPRAPGLGLRLQELHYDSYNRGHAARLGYRTLDWARFESHREAFKAAWLMPDIYSGEADGCSMLTWLQQLSELCPYPVEA